MEELAEAVQEATGESVELAYVDKGYTGEEHGIRLEVVKRPEAKRGFVLLPRRWVVERDFAWASRFWRASSSTERSPYSGRVYNTLQAGVHFCADRVRRMSRYYSAESIGAMMVHTTHNMPQMTRVATGLQKAIPTATT